jgi:hypothetical protein
MGEKLLYVGQKLMVSIRKVTQYIDSMGVSGTDVQNVTRKIQLTTLIMKQWMTYQKTKQRSKQITDAGFNLIEMWE